MTCPNCGAAVADNRRFCGKCGTSLAPAPPDPATAAPTTGMPTGAAGAPPTAWGSSASPYAPPPPADATPPAAADPFAPPDLNAPPGYAAAPPYPPPPAYGAPPGYPPPGAPAAWTGGHYGYAAPPHNNGFAIASLVLGLLGVFTCGLGSVIAIVLGFVSRDQIKRSWGRQTGSGMATAGIILGFLGAAFWLVVMILSIVDSAGSTSF